VTSEEMIKVSEFVTFMCVALVKPLGFFLLFVLSHVCKVSFVWFFLLFALSHVCKVSFVCSFGLNA
jgi:hypothetical protein